MRRVKLSLVCTAFIVSVNLQAVENLGLITVESTTIDDKYESNKKEVSNTVTIHTDEIEEVHAENLGDVLNKIPGLTVRVNEGDSNKIHIRGIATETYMGEKPGVAIVIDGVPVQERAGSVNIDLDNIESIKVIKGGASYLYGNDALAGAVIITTKRPKGKTGGSFSIEKGSFNYEKYLVQALGSTDDFAVELKGSYKASDGYWDASDYWTKSVNGKFQYFIDDSSDITLGLDKSKRFENDTGSITAVVDGVNQIETNPKSFGEVGYNTNYNIDLDKYFLTYSKDFENDSNLMSQIYLYEDLTTNRSGAFDEIPGNGLLRDGHKYDAYAKTQQKGLKSEYRIDGDSIASMIGIDIARNKEDKNSVYRVDYTSRGTTTPKGTVNSDTHFNEDINAIYAELKYQLSPKVVTSLNARYDNMKYDYTNKLTSQSWEEDFNEQSYRLGATYSLSKNAIIYSNVSTGFRVPTIAQMYAGDMSTSTYNGTYTNNTDIDTEKTYNFEIGYRGKNDFLTYDVAVFQIERKDVIGRSSGNYASTRGVDVQYDNMADVRSRGLELSLSSDKSKDLYFGLNYTFLDTKYTRYDEYNLILNEGGVVDQNGDGDTRDDYVDSTHNLSGNKVPRVPAHTISLEANYKLTPKFLVTTELNYKSSQFADELNRVKVKAYSVVNLRTKYNTKIGGFPFEFFAKVDNVFDKQYYMMPRVTSDRNDDNAYDSGDMGLTVNPGRTFFAGLKMSF